MATAFSKYMTGAATQTAEPAAKHPYSNVELAQKLGYSNPNNFRRACKRWLGIVLKSCASSNLRYLFPIQLYDRATPSSDK